MGNITDILDWMYKGRKKEIINILGIDKLGKPIYNKIERKYHPNIVKLEISDEEVSFHTDTWTEYRRFKNVGEASIIDDVISNVSEDDVFFDIGANVGTFTIFAASQTEEVYSFDPIQNNLARLNENLYLNGLHAHLLPIALSNTNEVDILELTTSYESSTGNSGHILSSAVSGNESYKSDSVPNKQVPIMLWEGDSLISNGIIPQPTVIKIDVDGSEHLVIDGLSDSLAHTDCHTVYIENHRGILEDIGVDWRDIESKIKNYGFEIERMNIPDRSEESGTYMLKGVK